MTNAELLAKIKAEIERLYDEANNYDDSRHYLGEVLSFLDTIEESEKSVPNDLEEAAKAAATEVYTYTFQGMDDLIGLFKDGAKWQKEQTEKRWLEDRDGCFWDGVEEGKKAMKEQMMKEAVEGTIFCQRLNRYIYLKEIDESLHYGDKVRVIVLSKED